MLVSESSFRILLISHGCDYCEAITYSPYLSVSGVVRLFILSEQRSSSLLFLWLELCWGSASYVCEWALTLLRHHHVSDHRYQPSWSETDLEEFQNKKLYFILSKGFVLQPTALCLTVLPCHDPCTNRDLLRAGRLFSKGWDWSGGGIALWPCYHGDSYP